MLFFVGKGYRVVAHDRRGHGRSTQVGDGHDMDHYAADAATVVEHLDLRNAVHVGHSTGGAGGDHQRRPAGLPEGVTAAVVRLDMGSAGGGRGAVGAGGDAVTAAEPAGEVGLVGEAGGRRHVRDRCPGGEVVAGRAQP